MKRNCFWSSLIGVALLSALVVFAVGDRKENHGRTPDGVGEISIRNLAGETMCYWVLPDDDVGAELKRTIAEGVIHRFPGTQTIQIRLDNGNGGISYTLKPNSAYSIRNDLGGAPALYAGAHGLEDAADLAPYVATDYEVVEKMLEMSDVGDGDIVYDLGCGDGRIVIQAAEKFGARGVGIDIVAERIEESKRNSRASGVEHLVEFVQQDVMKADFSEATVVTLYLLPESNAGLRPILEDQLQPGTRVISHNYEIPGWEEREIRSCSIDDAKGEYHNLFLYRR